MFNVTEWELFYTTSEKDEDYLVNQICIDAVNKRYILETDVSCYVTDGFDECGNEIFSTYVSKEVFDILVKSVKENGFKECGYGDL